VITPTKPRRRRHPVWLAADALLTAVTVVVAVLVIAGYSVDLSGLGW
jgi:hypothetical protein